jgi:predicted metal-dependent peptidase
MNSDAPRTDDIVRKLTAARTQLIIEKPFLGALVLRLPLVPADPAWCKTTATDARGIYYNRAYVEALSLEQTKFVLAHEALHCGLSHFHRRQHRVKHRWDVACDFAVNSLLVADGLMPPPAALLRGTYDGMSAEEIYPYIKEHTDDETIDRHLYDEDDTDRTARGEGAHGSGHAGQTKPEGDETDASGNFPNGRGGAGSDGADEEQPAPPPLTAQERERLATQWQLRLAGAAQQALRAGKLSASMARLVDDLLQPQLPWRMLLARYLTSNARTDYSFSRPSRREGTAILPGLRAAYIEIAVVIDTSGSIEPGEMQEFLSEVNAIKGSLNARIVLHACDAQLTADGPWTYEPWDELRLPKRLIGGGGTRFTPAIEWAERLDRPPDLLLYFTDAEGEFPAHAPSFPVLWLVKGRAPVPWGQRVQLN